MMSLPRSLVVAALLLVLVAAQGAGASYSPSTAVEYVYLSAVAYCNSGNILRWNCNACSHVSLNATAYLYDQSLNVAGYVGKFHGEDRAAVAFRGTLPSSLEDWIDDLKFAKVVPYNEGNCNGCQVHDGFLSSYQSLANEMFAALEAIGTRNVVVTGHSLGAAMAALAAFELANRGYSVSIITFGQPRVGNQAFSQAYHSKLGGSYRVVHYKDIVPHLPLKDMGFYHVPTEVWYQEDNTTYKVCNGSGEDPSCSDSLLLPDSISDHLDYLNIKISGDC